MLLDLPFEIIVNVASYLHFDDKFQLMLTCRALHPVIQDHSLYEELDVMGGHFGPDIVEIINKFKSKRLNGEQVKQLAIDLDRVPDSLYGELPNIFPNVEAVFNEQEKPEKKRPYTVIKFLKKWKDSITSINMEAGYTHIIRILEKKNNTFTKLTRLRISPYIYTDFNMWKDDVNVLDCLKNAPALTELDLHHGRVNIDFLEAVHRSCPALEILNLVYSIILTSDDTLPQTITPAEKVVYFTINGTTVVSDDNCVLLDYIVSKYPKLQTLGFFARLNCSLINQTVNPLDAKPRGMWLREGQDFPVIQTKQVKFTKTNEAYRDHGSERLFARLPKSVEFVSIDTSMFDNIIDAMSKSEFQPKDLSFCLYNEDATDNTYSEVFKTEQDLAFLRKQTRLERLVTEISAKLFENAGVLTQSLKKLKVSIKGEEDEEAQLGWILNAFPSLESLTIPAYSDVEVMTPSPINGKCYPKLNKLKIYNNLNPTLELTKYISAVAPNLKKIVLSIGEDSDEESDEDEDENSTKALDELTEKVKAIHIGVKTRSQTAKEKKEKEEEQRRLEEKNKPFFIDLSGLNLDLFHLQTSFEDNEDPERILQMEIRTKDKKVHQHFLQPGQWNLLAPWHYKSLDEVKYCKSKRVKRLIIVCDSMKQFKCDELCGSIKL